MFSLRRRTAVLAISCSMQFSLSIADSAPGLLAGNGASAHAPIGVMGDHVHKAGEWMLSYRHMDMAMDGLLDGDDQVAASAVTGTMMAPGRYMVAPEKMHMHMQMLGLMYAPSDRVTLMAMLPHKDLSMDHVTRMGVRFTTKSSGWGDLKVGGLISLFQSEDHRHNLHLNAGVNLPTGSIDAKDDTPALADAKLPYGMQLGSGSYDLLPGVTYQAYLGAYNLGAQLTAVLPTGRNDNDYRLGNSAALSAWVTRHASEAFAYSLRVTAESQGKIDGRRSDLNPAMVTTADADNYGGDSVSLSWGINSYIPSGALQGHRLALEFTLPVYQQLNGIQLEREPCLSAGWQLAF